VLHGYPRVAQALGLLARADIIDPLDALARRVDEIYLHIDFDGFAPEVAPGIVDDPIPGGLSLEQAETIIRATSQRFRIRAATLATYTPDRDQDDKTLRLGLQLIDLIGDHGRNVFSSSRSGPAPHAG
jgi:arginase family enzyme